MSDRNRYGLARDIPASVAREVRQRCGFGCVMCGCAIYQYEHHDPPFAEARVHDASGIVLLCGACHDRRTRGLLSPESVTVAAQKPRARQSGFSFGMFDVGDRHPDVRIGSVLARNSKTILRILGDDVLSVQQAEVSGGPFRISATLCDAEGQEIIRIVDNVWQAPVTNWDVEVVGKRISVRSTPRRIELCLRTEPPQLLVVEKLDMHYRGIHVVCDEPRGFSIQTGRRHISCSEPTQISNAEVVMEVSSDEITIGRGGRFTGNLEWGSAPPASRSSRLSLSPLGEPHAVAARPNLKGASRNLSCPCGSGRKFKKCHGV
jgi:SEC-C motif-containing protein